MTDRVSPRAATAALPSGRAHAVTQRQAICGQVMVYGLPGSDCC